MHAASALLMLMDLCCSQPAPLCCLALSASQGFRWLTVRAVTPSPVCVGATVLTLQVPWWNMTYHIPVAELSGPALQAILDAPAAEVDAKRQLLRSFAADVLWDAPNSRVTTNAIFEAYHRCAASLQSRPSISAMHDTSGLLRQEEKVLAGVCIAAALALAAALVTLRRRRQRRARAPRAGLRI